MRSAGFTGSKFILGAIISEAIISFNFIMMKTIPYCVLGLLFFIFVGCRSNLPEGIPPRYPCRITITGDGSPIEGANVMLFPESSDPTEKTWTPMGTTDESGVAQLFTNARYEGAPAGKYKIVVVKLIGEKNPGVPPAPPEDSPQYVDWQAQWMDRSILEFDVIDTRYGNAETTPSEIEIVKSKMNEAQIDVGKAVRIKRP